jgi:YebC/PmpR family DNA-binding regulatory protein
MAGHSKWANIQYRKSRQDAAKSRVFTKIIREITVAARMGGGGDPDFNPRLRLALDKAFAANMSKDSVERAIKKATGELEGVRYEEIRYEGYGPGGAAVMVDCMTDNRTRTVADVRHAFSKCGGNLGADGSVAYQFTQAGVLGFDAGQDEDAIFGAALEAGAEDVVSSDDAIEVITQPGEYPSVKAALEKVGFRPRHAEVTMRANTPVSLTGGDAERCIRLLEMLDALDDVQNVYTNAEFPDAIAG